ncbi:Zn-dependent hydrolase, glyoxylase [Desulfosporosinus acidiphilus SJ4]|uniref:Zn-dependent hydrolase, glyoxylase n=1 Tax=Desulfosporosinus acidiphilus (strain DSM 22704 / JCM 16185 / SJ4) TaxID=646529 RepID=I4DC19_DESAJ|nr:MBL fold metallo-hydrolase [Desulfosporosinus acidiphilus]AFM43343.1 Zn-dependent hydrolase, glyoxylase [Desulfosporosinus acidiphilus SJ4]
MKIANGVEALELTVNLMGRQTTIYPTLFWDEKSVILVDAGFPGLEQQIRAVIEKAGVPYARLNKVIITHQDIDHIGSLPEILVKSQQKIEVLAHKAEKPYIQGDKPLIKAETAKNSKTFETLPEEQRKRLQAVFANPPKANVDRTIDDGEEIADCGGIIVIFTPGHTPGHICLYHKSSKTLVTGDALTANDGELTGPNPSATYDLDEARKSVKKLAQYDIQTVICYHGGVIKEDVQNRIRQIAL